MLKTEKEKAFVIGFAAGDVFWHQLSHTQRYLQTMRLCLGRSPITGAVRDWFNVLVYDRQRLTCDLFLKV